MGREGVNWPERKVLEVTGATFNNLNETCAKARMPFNAPVVIVTTYYPPVVGGVESAAERVERARAEPAGQTMDFNAGRGRLSVRCGRRPNVNAISMRGKSKRDQPRVVCHAARVGWIFAGDDMPGDQRPLLAFNRRAFPVMV
jgi:hypothetical protein